MNCQHRLRNSLPDPPPCEMKNPLLHGQKGWANLASRRNVPTHTGLQLTSLSCRTPTQNRNLYVVWPTHHTVQLQLHSAWWAQCCLGWNAWTWCLWWLLGADEKWMKMRCAHVWPEWCVWWTDAWVCLMPSGLKVGSNVCDLKKWCGCVEKWCVGCMKLWPCWKMWGAEAVKKL